MNEEAKAYAQRVVARAEGDASRFNQVLVQYLKAPEVTRQRLYQDMMQQVLANTSKVVADQKSGTGLLYLPLDKLIQASALANLAGSDSSGAGTPSPVGTGTANSPQETPPENDLRGRDAMRNREREVRP